MAALDAVEIASLVIESPEQGPLVADRVRPLIEAAQARGVAALLMNDVRLARTLKADGVHLAVSPTSLADYATALEILGSRGLIGVDAGRSRHDAMALGEAGADYVAFGIPDFVAERDIAMQRQIDLVQWWAEIFEVPVVAFDVAIPEQAGALALVGADFVSLRLSPAATYGDVKVLVESAWTQVKSPMPVREVRS